MKEYKETSITYLSTLIHLLQIFFDLVLCCPPRQAYRRCTSDLLIIRLALYIGVDSPSPLAWCKAFDARDNRSVYQVLLRSIPRIRHGLGER